MSFSFLNREKYWFYDKFRREAQPYKLTVFLESSVLKNVLRGVVVQIEK